MSFMLLPKLKCLVLCAYKPCQFQTMVKHQFQIYCSKSSFNCSYLLPGKDPFAIVTALSFSESTKSYFLGTQLHAHVIKLGLTKDVFSQNNLIKMYIKCGAFSHAFKLFDDMVERNLVSWTLMISSAVQNDEFQVGLEVYLDLIRSGLQPNEFTLGSVLKICASVGSYEFGSSIHCSALKIGIEHNIFVGGSILNMYAKLEDIQSAKAVFKSMTNVDVGCWNAIIGGYVLCGDGIDAFKTVSLMLSRGVNMDQLTFINTLKGCSIMENLDFGKRLHGLIIQRDMEYSTSLMNCLMDMYFRNGREDSALKVFMRIQNKDAISWNTAFASSQHENAKTLVSLFHEFRLDALKPNHITFSILFRLCAELVDLDLGFQFFCLALQFGFLDEANITCSLINMFSRCKAMKLACLIFDNDKVHLRNITAWNELISGYNLNSRYMEALKVFVNLWGLGVELNEYTFSSVLEACSKYENQQMVRQIHGAVVKSGFSSNGYVGSLLINCYVKFGLLDDCFEFFNGLERLDDLACWGTIISALTRGGHTYEAIRFLRSLKEANGKPDEFIFGSILNCCASIAGYRLTKSVHSLITKMGFDTQVFVASGVVDAYAKCGDINSARMAYRQSYRMNDVILHNTMIMAFAHHGLVMEAMEIFETMKMSNLQPSQATFVSAISACSHMGLIDQGFLLFRSMITDYKMEPSPDVYGCLVDMLSRNGYLDNARQVIEVMPYTPWPAILRSLLSGCRIHGNRELGEWTAKKLLQLVPEHDAPYVLLSKVYSECGGWEDAGKVWRSMIERGVPKNTGYSRIEI